MIDTIEVLLRDGKVKPRKRTTVDDLLLAADWLESYEGDPSDDVENLTGLASVADKLRREAARRTV